MAVLPGKFLSDHSEPEESTRKATNPCLPRLWCSCSNSAAVRFDEANGFPKGTCTRLIYVPFLRSIPW